MTVEMKPGVGPHFPEPLETPVDLAVRYSPSPLQPSVIIFYDIDHVVCNCAYTAMTSCHVVCV